MLDRPSLRDLALLVAVGTGLGTLHLALRPELDWLGEAPETTCGADEAAVAAVDRIGVQEVQVLLHDPSVTFVDARSAASYEAGHIPGAISLPADTAAGVLAVQSIPIPPENLVITYCDGGTCEQSEYLGMLLEDRAGCEQVKVLADGWLAWTAAGAPIEEGAAP